MMHNGESSIEVTGADLLQLFCLFSKNHTNESKTENSVTEGCFGAPQGLNLWEVMAECSQEIHSDNNCQLLLTDQHGLSAQGLLTYVPMFSG